MLKDDLLTQNMTAYLIAKGNLFSLDALSCVALHCDVLRVALLSVERASSPVGRQHMNWEEGALCPSSCLGAMVARGAWLHVWPAVPV